MPPDGAKDALAGALRSGRVVGDHNRELVAAEPEDLLVRADRAQEDAGERREHLVARRVAEGVVDLLEVVDVEEHEGDVGRLDQGVEVLVEGAPVREPGQRVAACLGEGQRRPALQGERPRREVGRLGDDGRVELDSPRSPASRRAARRA